jgi:hypothetical protein
LFLPCSERDLDYVVPENRPDLKCAVFLVIVVIAKSVFAFTLYSSPLGLGQGRGYEGYSQQNKKLTLL